MQAGALGQAVLVSGGSQVQITAYDVGVLAANDRLLAPESPPGVTPSIVSEITRLMDGIAPVVVLAGVVDRPVNPGLVYQQDRLNAVQDLCKRISADYRFNGNKQLEVYPLTPQTPVWTIQGGPEGVLVSVDRSQNLTGLYNQFVADGTATVNGQQVPIRGVATINAGPLRWGGPHGKYPEFYQSNLLTTQADCDAYAQTMMTTQLSGLSVDLKIVCLPHPGLQQGDWVTVIAPTVNNHQVSLIGRVTQMGLKSNGNTVDRMTLTVQCTYTDVQAAIGGVDRG